MRFSPKFAVGRVSCGRCAVVVAGLVVYLALLVTLVASAPSGEAASSGSAIVGPNACAECHKQEVEAWKGTHHYKTFRDMPRNPAANEIARRMGIRRVKSESVCLGCHFTVEEKDGRKEPVAGISCESCHGAGKEWIKVHSSYSGKKKETESKSEAAARWKLAEQKGMIRPRSLYRLAENCLSCHVVPDEALVNKGGHRSGSAFELVSWSQGEVRHNTWSTQGKENKAASAARRRMLYLIGLGVELETALRAVATATARQPFAFEMAARADRTRKSLDAAAKAVPGVPEIARIVEHAYAVSLKLDNKAALTAAADEISKLLKTLSETHDGSAMAGLDGFIPDAARTKGTARPASGLN